MPKRRRSSSAAALSLSGDDYWWTCPSCTLENPSSRHRCEVCQARKSIQENAAAADQNATHQPSTRRTRRRDSADATSTTRSSSRSPSRRTDSSQTNSSRKKRRQTSTAVAESELVADHPTSSTAYSSPREPPPTASSNQALVSSPPVMEPATTWQHGNKSGNTLAVRHVPDATLLLQQSMELMQRDPSPSAASPNESNNYVGSKTNTSTGNQVERELRRGEGGGGVPETHSDAHERPHNAVPSSNNGLMEPWSNNGVVELKVAATSLTLLIDCVPLSTKNGIAEKSPPTLERMAEMSEMCCNGPRSTNDPGSVVPNVGDGIERDVLDTSAPVSEVSGVKDRRPEGADDPFSEGRRKQVESSQSLDVVERQSVSFSLNVPTLPGETVSTSDVTAKADVVSAPVSTSNLDVRPNGGMGASWLEEAASVPLAMDECPNPTQAVSRCTVSGSQSTSPQKPSLNEKENEPPHGRTSEQELLEGLRCDENFAPETMFDEPCVIAPLIASASPSTTRLDAEIPALVPTPLHCDPLVPTQPLNVADMILKARDDSEGKKVDSLFVDQEAHQSPQVPAEKASETESTPSTIAPRASEDGQFFYTQATQSQEPLSQELLQHLHRPALSTALPRNDNLNWIDSGRDKKGSPQYRRESEVEENWSEGAPTILDNRTNESPCETAGEFPVFRTAGLGSRLRPSDAGLAKAASILELNPYTPWNIEAVVPQPTRISFPSTGAKLNGRNPMESSPWPSALPFSLERLGPLNAERQIRFAGSRNVLPQTDKFRVQRQVLALTPVLQSRGPLKQRIFGQSGMSTPSESFSAMHDSAKAHDGARLGGYDGAVPPPTTQAERDNLSPLAAVPMFKTAGLGQTVSFRQENFKYAEQLLGDVPATKLSLNEARSEKTDSHRPMFTTAGLNRPVTASAATLAQVDSLFRHDGPQGPPVRLPLAESEQSSSNMDPPVFKTAGLGETVSFRQENFKYAEQLLGDVQATKLSLNEARSERTNSHRPMFTTAGLNKPVTASAATLARVVSLFREDRPQEPPLRLHLAESEQSSSNMDPPVFKTAGRGKTVSLGQESLKYAEQLLGDVQAAKLSLNEARSEKTDSHRPMFTTAGLNQPVAASAATLAKVDSLFRHDRPPGPPVLLPLAESGQSSSNMDTPVFKTAGLGNTVSLGQESLKYAEQLLGVAHAANLPTSAARSEKPDCHGPMFTTAGSTKSETGSAVTFRDDKGRGPPPGLSGSTGQSCVSISSCVYFKSAGSNKDIAITEEALSRAMSVLAGEFGGQHSAQAQPHISFQPTGPDGTSQTSATIFKAAGLQKSASLIDFCLKHSERLLGHSEVVVPATALRSRRDFHSSAHDSGTGGVLPVEESSIDSSVDNGVVVTRLVRCADITAGETTLFVTSLNALSIRFNQDTGLPKRMADNAADSYDIDTGGQVKDYRQSLRSHGVDDALVSDKWIENHVRWLLWKFAAIERFFREELDVDYLSFERVASALYRRFEKEVIRGQRSALKRILNRDLSSSRMMVICVAAIWQSDGPEAFKIEATDGWYSVRARPDACISQFIQQGRIRVGTKLLFSNARLVGCPDGVDPTDSSYDVRVAETSPEFVICANSTRLARWDAKLGLVPLSEALVESDGLLQTRKVSDVLEGGGNIHLIDLVVVKIHPTLYYQHQSPAADSTVSRPSRVYTEAEEVRRASEHDRRKTALIEKIVETIEEDCAQEVDEDAPQIWRDFVGHASPDCFFLTLDAGDRRLLEGWKEKRQHLLQKRIQEEIDEKLKEFDCKFVETIPFVRVQVRSALPKVSPAGSEEAILTIWNPSADQMEALVEEKVVRVKDLVVKEARYDGLLQFSANSCTKMELTTSTRLPPTVYTTADPNNIFKIHLLSKDSADDHLQVSDVLGVVLRVEKQLSTGTWAIHLTDRSGLLLRIIGTLDREAKLPFHLQVSDYAACKLKNCVVLARFQHLKLRKFDNYMGSAVAQFDGSSKFHAEKSSPEATFLRSWLASVEGSHRLARISAMLESGIPQTTANAAPSVFFGYIASLRIAAKYQLCLEVDCGHPKSQIWAFPLKVVQSFVNKCADARETVVFDEDEERKVSAFPNLEPILRSRDCLYRFLLHRLVDPLQSGDAACEWEVVEVDPVKPETLARLDWAFRRIEKH